MKQNATNKNDLGELQKELEKQGIIKKGVCPNCGYCPTCGRSLNPNLYNPNLHIPNITYTYC